VQLEPVYFLIGLQFAGLDSKPEPTFLVFEEIPDAPAAGSGKKS
jgi:hypothetical protein